MILEQEANSGGWGDWSDAPAPGSGLGGLGGASEGGPRWSGELDAAVQDAVGLGNDPGLGLLLDLAKRGEYDPWDVDIVAVTDSYLTALDERLDARDLGRVARLIFYAAALIHLKAKVLAERQKTLDYEEALEQTLAEELELELSEGGFGGPRLRPDDQPLDYGFLSDPLAGPGGLLAPRDRPVRPRGLSLVDLIYALREYDERLAQREQELAEEPDFDADIALDECVGSSHQEDLDQDIVDVRLALWELLAEGSGADRIEVTALSTEHRSRAGSYLALLFLAQDEEVELDQETFYGEVWITRGRYFGEVRAGVHDEELELDLEDEDEDESAAEAEQGDGDEGELAEDELEGTEDGEGGER